MTVCVVFDWNTHHIPIIQTYSNINPSPSIPAPGFKILQVPHRLPFKLELWHTIPTDTFRINHNQINFLFDFPLYQFLGCLQLFIKTPGSQVSGSTQVSHSMSQL